ncbi:MAG: phosphoribosylformylglycinamidine synthase I [Thermoplasmata archaeon]|nr:phosphoribosylformylglycinamidine synthase I [Thermoplasmata archaeon]MCI4359254.1 phosphoribosylformylglycinamidine synthase I [Thermoplasmata archaeon]
MRRSDVRVALLTIEGTNCDAELGRAVAALGANPEVVHLKQFEHRDVEPNRFRDLDQFSLLLIPGGFSSGDYVRAGAIFAARIRAAIGPQLEAFVRSGRQVGGICNGFQVLTELGLLPGRPGRGLGSPEAALVTNDSGHYECRPTWVEWGGGCFGPLSGFPVGTRFLFPSGHGEGKLILSGPPGDRLAALRRSGQILFRWTSPDGSTAQYPWNPNGSEGDVAGLTNRQGNVFGLMPHPERAFDRSLAPDWTRSSSSSGPGDGSRFLDAVLSAAERTG